MQYEGLIAALAILTVVSCDGNERVYNGEDAYYGEFPFMAYLLVNVNGYYYQCGASIVSENWILTAAHCVDGASYVSVTVGKLDSSTGVAQQEFEAESWTMHEDYDSTYLNNDIALIKLNENFTITFSDYVSPIALPTDDDAAMYDEGAAVTVIGWGGTESASLADILQKLPYEMVSDTTCSSYWGSSLKAGMVCTGSDPPDEEHSWAGDSGGPLFGTDGDGSPKQVALVSWGVSDDSVLTYDVNTNVLYFVQSGWIKSIMGSTDDDPDDDSTSVYLKFKGDSDSMGIVLGTTHSADAPADPEYWGVVCNDGMGRNEAEAMCKYFGYDTGIVIDPYHWQTNSSDLEDYWYKATDISCPAGADDPSQCVWTDYEDAEVPCVDGQQLAVSCSDEKFEFEVYEVGSNVNKKGKAKFECYAYAYKYGQAMDLKDNFEAFFLNRDMNGTYTHIDADMKYKKKRGNWKGKAWVSDIEEDDRCFICAVRASHSNSYIFTAAADSDCAYGEQDSDMLKQEIMEYFMAE